MIPEAEDLTNALFAVYRPWVRHILESRGWELSPAVSVNLDDGEQWLRSELEALLSEPFENQPRGPLEVFQEAMRFPTSVLSAEKKEPVRRDDSVVNALPGDIFDLAPASSAQLGEQAWQAHLRWGAAKAAAFVRPDEA